MSERSRSDVTDALKRLTKAVALALPMALLRAAAVFSFMPE
jgi:hypothetical protein